MEKLASFESARNLSAGKKKTARKKKDKNQRSHAAAAGGEEKASDALKVKYLLSQPCSLAVLLVD